MANQHPKCSGFQKATGHRDLSWQGELPIKLSIDRSIPENFHSDILNAIRIWNENVGVELFVLENRIEEASHAEEDGKNLISWVTNWKRNTNLQASTDLYWNESEIRETDIQLNAQHFRIRSLPKEEEIDFQSLLIHELGHVLGLRHSHDQSSVMVVHLTAGEVRRHPSDEDLKNIRCRYETAHLRGAGTAIKAGNH